MLYSSIKGTYCTSENALQQIIHDNELDISVTHTDNGTFLGDFSMSTLKVKKIKHIFFRTKQPWTNQIERVWGKKQSLKRRTKNAQSHRQLSLS
jgi:hypothetical protein